MDRSVDVLIVGAAAGASCAVELRERGFEGSVLLAGRELDPPYERPPISADYLLSKAATFMPVPEDVELLTRTSVMKLDPAAKVATLSTKETVGWRAVLCTGANVRRLPIEGSTSRASTTCARCATPTRCGPTSRASTAWRWSAARSSRARWRRR